MEGNGEDVEIIKIGQDGGSSGHRLPGMGEDLENNDSRRGMVSRKACLGILNELIDLVVESVHEAEQDCSPGIIYQRENGSTSPH